MLYRTSTLIHPGSGASLRTPLLVPSYSSKAFGFSQGGQPEVLRVLDASREFITRTCLISAYDVYYKYIPAPEDFPITVDLMFLDSGGYEVSEDRDLSAVDKPVHRPQQWDAGKLEAIVDRWPDRIPAVFVSYDHSNERKPVAEQIRGAKEFLQRHPGHLHSFLLKPQSMQEQTLEAALQELAGRVRDLAGFHLLGVTEKELGNSILERMVRIANLRQVLDAAGLAVAIHVFGALDPLSVSLYFVAGAEIFDGLTWVRYAYNGGKCIYIQNNATLTYGIEVSGDELRVRTIVDNLRYLQQLERSLRRLGETKDWNHLPTHREFVRQAGDKLESRLRRRE